MKNRGNTGHKGYKMSKVVSVTSNETHALINLECGHVQHSSTGYKETPEQTATALQCLVACKLRCNESHQAVAQEAQ